MWGSNPRPLANKTNTLPTELMERVDYDNVESALPTTALSNARSWSSGYDRRLPSDGPGFNSRRTQFFLRLVCNTVHTKKSVYRGTLRAVLLAGTCC